MKYNEVIDGVKLEKDVWAEQFADPGDIKQNYMVSINGEFIDEDLNSSELADRLLLIADRLTKIANFLNRIKSKN